MKSHCEAGNVLAKEAIDPSASSTTEREVGGILLISDSSLNKMKPSFGMEPLCVITSVGLSQQLRILMPSDQAGRQHILQILPWGLFCFANKPRIFYFELGGSQWQFAGLVSFPVLGRRKSPHHLIGFE